MDMNGAGRDWRQLKRAVTTEQPTKAFKRPSLRNDDREMIVLKGNWDKMDSPIRYDAYEKHSCCLTDSSRRSNQR